MDLPKKLRMIIYDLALGDCQGLICFSLEGPIVNMSRNVFDGKPRSAPALLLVSRDVREEAEKDFYKRLRCSAVIFGDSPYNVEGNETPGHGMDDCRMLKFATNMVINMLVEESSSCRFMLKTLSRLSIARSACRKLRKLDIEIWDRCYGSIEAREYREMISLLRIIECACMVRLGYCDFLADTTFDELEPLWKDALTEGGKLELRKKLRPRAMHANALGITVYGPMG